MFRDQSRMIPTPIRHTAAPLTSHLSGCVFSTAQSQAKSYKGQRDLEASVRSYLPNFRVRDEKASREARVITLLTHMGGWEGDLFIDTGEGDDALSRAVAEMACGPQKCHQVVESQ